MEVDGFWVVSVIESQRCIWFRTVDRHVWVAYSCIYIGYISHTHDVVDILVDITNDS